MSDIVYGDYDDDDLEEWRMGISANGLIEAIRGGAPTQCDFCNRAIEDNDYMPEEGGEWACGDCWRRFNEEDRLEAARMRAEGLL